MSEERYVERLKNYELTRRRMLGAGALAFLAACSKKISPTGSGGGGATPSAAPTELEGELSIYNWADYVNPKTYPAFEKEFDLKITEDNYASNEDALAKLKAGAEGYDIVVPTGYMVEVMIAEGLLYPTRPFPDPEPSNVEPQLPRHPVRSGQQVQRAQGLRYRPGSGTGQSSSRKR